jgi:hypothetical protein
MGDNRYPGDTQFAGLVEAATAAADQEIHWSANAEVMNPDVRPAYEAYETRAPPEDSYNPVPTGQYDDSIATSLAGPSTRKRKRDIEILREDRMAADGLLPNRHNAMSDAPRPSVAATSAAAIFRQSSATSKKYTRPPIGKLYSSLQLSPENFVHLQTAAKAYMLDKNHPERLDTIGQRGRGDTDLVRLKLWNFVKEFLDDLGNGQKFFGDHVPDVEGQGPRTMIWPQDAEQIIKACVPVMRRMVTNERQRQYAMQARKATEDIHGLESGTRRHVAAASAGEVAGPPELSAADIQGLEIIDLLNDGCVPGAYEAADWYSEHERQLDVHTGLSSQLDERDRRVLVANMDGHYRLFHNGSVSQCTEDCEAQAVERLLSWDRLYNPNLISDVHEQHSRMGGIMHQLFGLVRSNLQPRSPDPDSVVLPQPDLAAENHEREPDAMSHVQSAVNRSRVPKKADPTAAVKRTEKRSRAALVLHVNLVSTDLSATSNPTFHSIKRLADPFLLSAVSVPNLQALQSQLQQHFGKTLEQLASSDANGASSTGKATRETPELSVKVWLPDGLVRVKGDGEWMVALLSAELVEWMDKEVKILVEILT